MPKPISFIARSFAVGVVIGWSIASLVIYQNETLFHLVSQASPSVLPAAMLLVAFGAVFGIGVVGTAITHASDAPLSGRPVGSGSFSKGT